MLFPDGRSDKHWAAWGLLYVWSYIIADAAAAGVAAALAAVAAASNAKDFAANHKGL